MITENKELNQYIDDFKKNKQLGLNVKKEFNEMLDKLIRRFGAKSEAQLIRLLRISLAHSKKDNFRDKIRAKIIQQAVLANAGSFTDLRST